ncbi:acyl-homoserine-lactone synthase [Aliivibrio sp. S3MY1]|uniref:acyl-homoserine-lactone synthase n=1 Tax=Aliivibrio sp. S2MY1 TaxID=3028423 RepID=UPI002379538C|nr:MULTISPECIES: acyl-homoserine-lactone synthase [unclassified Aliivibrio]MDD9194842.1 acyl-homoserine-lactone synthase [Aliivibrio sp. S3MY1]MDD9198617.1 acyl-homoserine-lactone synthase [Aliivibrio sp. S2MY1]
MGPHKKKQCDYFIEIFDSYCNKTDNPNLLQQIIENRKMFISSQLGESSIGNLADLFSTQTAKDTIGKQASPTLPKHYFLIEQIALRLFGCLLSCWTELEIFRTIKNAALSFSHCTNHAHHSYNSPVINEHYHYEIVADIALDTRLFHTAFCEQPLRLSDAIVLINIATFIKEHQWYEMLGMLNISSKGEHFILYQFNDKSAYPNIISSALINSPSTSRNWLFFDDFFQSPKWQPIQQSHSIFNLKCATKVSTALSQSQLMNKSSYDIEKGLFSSILDHSKVCEAIRLTVSGDKSKANFHLYLAQKGLANALKESGRDMVFTIIEKPAMVLFYQSINIHTPEAAPYLFTSAQDINKNGIVTYKGIWVLNNATLAFNQYNFKEYNVKIIELRKLLRNH